MTRADHGDDLFRLVYASRAVLPALALFEPLVADILKVARPNNARVGLTGMLLAHEGWFIQALEGPRRQVSRIFSDIGRDLRHVQIEMLSAGPAERRLFSDWSMCARTITPEAEPVLEGLEIAPDFDAFGFSGDKALRLLQALAPLGQAELKLAG